MARGERKKTPEGKALMGGDFSGQRRGEAGRGRAAEDDAPAGDSRSSVWWFLHLFWGDREPSTLSHTVELTRWWKSSEPGEHGTASGYCRRAAALRRCHCLQITWDWAVRTVLTHWFEVTLPHDWPRTKNPHLHWLGNKPSTINKHLFSPHCSKSSSIDHCTSHEPANLMMHLKIMLFK